MHNVVTCFDHVFTLLQPGPFAGELQNDSTKKGSARSAANTIAASEAAYTTSTVCEGESPSLWRVL